MERVRLVNSGTEAAMSAVRLARGVTGRDRIVKFEGCYHGHADGLLAAAGSGATTFGVPTSPGVPADFARNTIVLPFNQVDRLRDVCAAEGQQIAAVIVEPVAGNVGVILPKPGFLEGLREITRKHGILLIFDEVITGFRVGPGGAQALYGVSPDMTLLGKVIGGGLPIGAYGGRADIMEHVAPQGPVYQAGTLSGNPLAVAAGLATLKELARPGTYERLENLGRRLAHGIEEACREAGVPAFHARVGSMLCTFFTDAPVVDYATALRSDTKRYAAVHRGLLERGVYFAPSQFEAAFVSTAHTRPILDETLNAFAEALRSC
jgi:glutamate-1-semialdehyde 2,1-aminomutase